MAICQFFGTVTSGLNTPVPIAAQNLSVTTEPADRPLVPAQEEAGPTTAEPSPMFGLSTENTKIKK